MTALEATPSSVFVDTHALLALVNLSDAHHNNAVKVADALARSGARLTLSEWVLAEFLSHCSRPPLRREALRAMDLLQSSPDVTIVHADHRTFLRSLKVYRDHADKSWSLVDCTSMLICRRSRIRHVFTGDRHFVQAGFAILL